MPDPESKFLQLKEHVGVTADGNLEPLVAIGAAIAVPTMIPNPDTGELELGEVPHSVEIGASEQLTQEDGSELPARIVPGTRMVEVADVRIEAALLQTENWEQIKPPTAKQAAAAAKALSDAIDEAGTHTEPGEEA
jgi:hypothetical protein